ncbi:MULTISPECIES: N-acetyl-1-D-myo-inositol-2-amino-2-deoxy-alpha-D-glucopyranoside deacetylase [Actinokineospora]|uniref:1D-myo-inositol 2-acetamido-2-deoxy-alpha-D-glucopyranoside deacetylase n=1 Tax=Actinokineospora fastidiosa TaxID=1816 RepID=A0A918G288_9PSEU|nr:MULTISPECIES: N-acetyl-1-D-myo-inositol-2-amino-2-deoxy-alpha-D-glucopyranoside deacetylase [Actinokineospora]UVS77085.1 1D-myo-inositol 2-acetamido-2-deoxy-alpha-D-glucopyranoside deacetylase [Actinokineospora sp. UTMC 2448]GGS13597.1 1D-myo-inositol 2-acetamido-2-deoxy-alpha-D-glucopyranoside deacetylase [Actinokineospora fastidiosa]
MLTAPPRLLLVHAHPDDESLWTGGTIARYAAAGVQVTLVTCTLGEEGEIIPDSLAQLGAHAADQLGGYRVAELRAACAALGVSDHRYLGGMGRWRDSGMVDTPANAHPRAFVGGDLDEQAAALAAILAEVRPQVVVTYGPDGGYGHPDHIRAHEVTVAALASCPEVQRLYYAVVSEGDVEAGLAALAGVDLPYRMPEPGELPVVADREITTRVAIGDHLPAKLRALRAHATQVSVWQGAGEAADTVVYALSNGIAQPVLDSECYVLASGSGPVETDLFGGLAPVEHAGADR